MGKAKKYPVTSAIRALRAAQVDYIPHEYRYVEKGGTAASSEALGVDENIVIKTLILADQDGALLCVLMHGDQEVATGTLAKKIGAKSVSFCDPKTAPKHSGYQVGGTSPFGLKSDMPIYAPDTVRDLETIYINGGKRGFLVELASDALESALTVTFLGGIHQP